MLVLGLHSKDRKSTRDKANISDPKVNRGCPPITANRTSADCVQFSLGPSIQYIPLRVYHTGGFNAMKRYSGKCHQQKLAFFPKPNCQYIAINWIFCRNLIPHDGIKIQFCYQFVYLWCIYCSNAANEITLNTLRYTASFSVFKDLSLSLLYNLSG